MNDLIKRIEKEISTTETELIMRSCNDGWWNKFMEEKLSELKKKLEELRNDNNNLLDS
jgi:hypothetical protein